MAPAYPSFRRSFGRTLLPFTVSSGFALTQGAAMAAPLALAPCPLVAAQGVPLTQDLYLKASNTGAGDRFGGAIAAFGNRVVVGAPQEDSSSTGVNGAGGDNSATSAGAAYVFRLEAGEWVQEAYLKASNTGTGDEFGFSVALGEDVLVVGAPGEASDGTGQAQNNAPESGAVYVYRFTEAGGWLQTDYMKASNADSGDRFGAATAIDGEWLLVGAPGEGSGAPGAQGNNLAASAGAAYVFQDDGSGVWAQDAYLKSSSPDTEDEFGVAVDISMDPSGSTYAVVGARFEDSASVGVGGDPANNSASSAGAVFVFEESGSGWSNEAYLKGLNTGPGDQFGTSVAISESQIVVGAPDEDSSFGGVNPAMSDDTFGSAGAAYHFALDVGGWAQFSYIKASTPGPLDRFGYRVGYADGRILVSAVGERSLATGINGDESNNGAGFSGATYLFQLVQFVGLVQTAYIKSSNSQANDSFGTAVAITDRWAHTGATREDGSGFGTMASQFSNSAADAGAAYIFRLGDGPFLNYCFAASNSSGTYGRLTATGSGLVAANDVVLQASSLPANVFGFFIVGRARNFVMGPGGSLGNICVGGGQLGRYVGPGQIQNSGPAGSISLAIDATAIPSALGPAAALPGEEFHFQAWFRDSFLGMPASNFTEGLTVLFR